MWIGRPAASTVVPAGFVPVAPVSEASITWTCPVWQSRSGIPSCGSVWYQTTETLPASPAAIHGQKTRAFDGCATANGFVQVFPRSFVEIIRIWFGAGVSAPSQPPLVPAWRVLVSQTT